ncbi:aminoglycoside 6-adenylyltransferase [Paenibacillus cremeus]|uniref:Aminoglycoside 6-adenylyltransferase n=2 Tax=Paenibacillus cremeus TaxID=2163881 RepID=A0A559K6N7_9BACL|nr:aminoglycoside 6-adenylyltransferase [Paenibacillus cremeus]
MRAENEVLDQLQQYAQTDPKVRAVLLNGSRVNPNAPQDLFNDYDVVFAVDEPEYYARHQEWIGTFGELIMMQQNTIQEHGEQWYIFLMLFMDGVRIDLSFKKVEYINAHDEDSLTKVLLDKDQRIKPYAPPSDQSYVTHCPSKQEYDDVLNEIWWCSTNVAKGIWREELSYAKFMLDVIVKDAVIKLLLWHVGLHHDWSANVGKAGKWLEDFLSPELWEAFVRTYPGVRYEELWDALLATGELTRTVGVELAERLGYDYQVEDDRRVTAYLHKVRQLPKDAEYF